LTIRRDIYSRRHSFNELLMIRTHTGVNHIDSDGPFRWESRKHAIER